MGDQMPKSSKPTSVFQTFRKWELLPPRVPMPDELHGSFDKLLEALAEAFSPATDYEHLLIAQLAHIEWDIQRHASMRDASIRGRLFHEVIDAFTGQKTSNFEELSREAKPRTHLPDVELATKTARELLSGKKTDVSHAKKTLEQRDIDLQILLSRAHLNASGYGMHDEKVIKLTGQRRRMLEDFQRIVSARKANEHEPA